MDTRTIFRLQKTCIMPICLYGTETWTVIRTRATTGQLVFTTVRRILNIHRTNKRNTWRYCNSSIIINPLDSKGIIVVVHRIMRSWYTGRWWVSCYIWYSEEGPGQAAAPPSPLLAVPNVTAHSSTSSVPITVLLYDGPLLCGFNVAIKGLTIVTNTP